MSKTTSLMGSPAKTEAMAGTGHSRGGGGGLDDHDHPIPRLLHTRSNTSRRMLVTDKRRSTGVIGLFASNSYLRNGFLMNAHSSDLSTIVNTPI